MTSPDARLADGDAVLAIEVQPDFCPGGALPIAEGDQVIPVLNRWIDAAAGKGLPVYASRDFHPPGHVSFVGFGGPWPPHCLQDTPGAAWHRDLHLPEGTVRVTKGARLDRDQTSAFDETGLGADMRRRGVHRVFVGGLAQDVCVKDTVLAGLKEGFEMHLLLPATRPVARASGEAALAEMRVAGAVIEDEA